MPADNLTVGLTYQRKPRTYGLRFSQLDGIVLVLATAVTALTYTRTAGFSVLLLFVVGHFFLFCNVFRIRRTPELVWGAIFVLNCLAWTLAGCVELVWLLALPLPVTLGIILNELRTPHYHGIFARQINSRLDDYLAGQLR